MNKVRGKAEAEGGRRRGKAKSGTAEGGVWQTPTTTKNQQTDNRIVLKKKKDATEAGDTK